ncbi:hypothetical protein Dda_4287 [Drechslerella dactyloides]|uniref:Uncharacterized protein n=1 Tax=Drechslerella dactyloides TaxID=74499 RepID=A0AAD6J0D1_DREDA|nr:hypothetical protein Dda_4287 [Drechslerella dactyloides]
MDKEASVSLPDAFEHVSEDESLLLEAVTDDMSDSMDETNDGYVMVEAHPPESSGNASPGPPRTPIPNAMNQDSPTSPTSPPPELCDPEYLDDDAYDENIFLSPPPRPSTPTPSIIFTSSPLSPIGSRRALQIMTPRTSPPSPSSPVGDKQAHQSNPNHYPKLRSKLRKDRERELMNQKGVMGKNKLEDKRIRERMVHSLRKNLKVPAEIRAAIKALMRQIGTSEDPAWSSRLEKYSYMDFCEMWRFQYLEADELAQIKNWENSTLDDPAAIRYVISYCRHEVGLPPGGKG